MIKRGVECTECSFLNSLMPHNYNIEACDKFPLLPHPNELDYPSKEELKVAKDMYSMAHNHIAAEQERWIKRQKVKDLEHKEEIWCVELEWKQKEEEEQVEQLEAVVCKKANAISQALLEGCMGCDLYLQLGKLFSPSLVVHFFQVCSLIFRV